MEGESTYACSSKIVLDVPVYYYYLHFTYLIFHNIYRALGTNRSNLEVSCNGERKKAYFPIPSTDNILNILIFSLLLVFINLVTRMDRILWALRGKKSVHFFLFFRFSTASWIQKGGNRWHRNFAYLRGSAQKAIICEITRTDTCIKLNIQMYMC